MIPRIREVHLRNYRSIGDAVVRFSDLTVLVGPNGAGKTNLLDGLSFVQECLSTTVDAALRRRGGVLRTVRGAGEASEARAGFRIVMDLAPATVADYAFEIAASRRGAFSIAGERCVVSRDGRETDRFEVRGGAFQQGLSGVRSVIEPDRLALYAASSMHDFHPVYDFLTRMRTYSIDPGKLRELRDPGPGEVLEREGGNAAAVLREILESGEDRYARVKDLLEVVVPGLTHVEGATVGGKQFLLFTEGGGGNEIVALYPSNMSDGTLRMLGLLLAVYQPATPSVLLIEEPEATIHPAAAEVVMSVLVDAAKRSQVIVTTHSPDILDFKSLPAAAIRVVTKGPQGTTVAPVAHSSREVIREHLYSPGDLLRVDELNPDSAAASALISGTELFGEPVHTLSQDS